MNNYATNDVFRKSNKYFQKKFKGQMLEFYRKRSFSNIHPNLVFLKVVLINDYCVSSK